MHMNAYVERVIESVRQKHGNEPEFVQTVEEVLSSLSPVQYFAFTLYKCNLTFSTGHLYMDLG